MGARAPCPCLTQPEVGPLEPPGGSRGNKQLGWGTSGLNVPGNGTLRGSVYAYRRNGAKQSVAGRATSKGTSAEAGERILPFQQAYPRGSHELLSTFIMRQAAGA